MGCLVLLAFIGIQKDRLDLTFPSTPVPVALQLLAAKTGQKLLCSNYFANDAIFAHLENAPVDQLLEHLAQSLCAKWTSRPDGTKLLVTDPIAVRKIRTDKEAEDRAILANSLKFVAKRLSQEPEELDAKAIQDYNAKVAADETRKKAAEASKDWQRYFVSTSTIEESPEWRALGQLVPLLGFDYLCSLPYRAREVYAENPTNVQHAFPSGSDAILAKFRRELGLLKPNVDIRRIRMTVIKWEHTNSFNVRLQGFDANGKVVDQGSIRLNDDAETMKIPFSQRFNVPAQKGESIIPVLPESEMVRIALTTDSTDPKRAEYIEKLSPRFEEPVKNEPTQWHEAADVLEVAKATHRNLIGNVSDSIFATFWKDETLTPSQYLVKHKDDITQTPDGWLVVRSKESQSRVPRNVGKEFILDCLAKGGVGFDSASQFVGRTSDTDPFMNWLGDYLHSLFTAAGPYSTLSTLMDTDNLRLWSEFGSGIRESLKHGSTVQLSLLSPEARSHIRFLVYSGIALDDKSKDPTELLPNGIADGTVTMSVTEKPLIIGWSSAKGPDARKMPIDASMFGESLASGNEWWQLKPEYFRSWDRFRVGVYREYVLHFVIQPGNLTMTDSMSETFFDPKAKTLTELPAAIKAEVEKARLEELAKPIPPKDTGVIHPN